MTVETLLLLIVIGLGLYMASTSLAVAATIIMWSRGWREDAEMAIIFYIGNLLAMLAPLLIGLVLAFYPHWLVSLLPVNGSKVLFVADLSTKEIYALFLAAFGMVLVLLAVRDAVPAIYEQVTRPNSSVARELWSDVWVWYFTSRFFTFTLRLLFGIALVLGADDMAGLI